MELKTAELILKGCKVNDGITEPIRAIVRMNDRDTSVILKELDKPAIAAECFSALLLRGWGLNVPEPVLVNDGDGIQYFGSLEILYPSLKQKMNIDAIPESARHEVLQQISCIIIKWRQTPLAIAIDEVIGNKDRNIGNILWDGSEPYFIDHERCFDLIEQIDLNKLADLSNLSGESDKIKTLAVAAVTTLESTIIDEAQAATESLDTMAYNEYIKNKIPQLTRMVLNRFPQPQDLFNQTVQ